MSINMSNISLLHDDVPLLYPIPIPPIRRDQDPAPWGNSQSARPRPQAAGSLSLKRRGPYDNCGEHCYASGGSQTAMPSMPQAAGPCDNCGIYSYAFGESQAATPYWTVSSVRWLHTKLCGSFARNCTEVSHKTVRKFRTKLYGSFAQNCKKLL